MQSRTEQSGLEGAADIKPNTLPSGMSDRPVPNFLPNMFSLISIFALVVCASAGRLENRYLAPLPPTAGSSGGGSDLLAPHKTYLPPQQSLQQQTQQDTPVVIDALQRSGQYSAQSSQSSQYSSSSQGQYSGRLQTPARQVAIIRLANENPGDGNYAFSYETEDGTSAEERGQLKADGAEGTLSAQGSFSFTAPDNVRYTVTYTADENGFQPQGAHLPVPPPIPEAILKALADNAADEARGIVDDGSYKDESTSSSNHRTSQQAGYQQQRPAQGPYRY